MTEVSGHAEEKQILACCRGTTRIHNSTGLLNRWYSSFSIYGLLAKIGSPVGKEMGEAVFDHYGMGTGSYTVFDHSHHWRSNLRNSQKSIRHQLKRLWCCLIRFRLPFSLFFSYSFNFCFSSPSISNVSTIFLLFFILFFCQFPFFCLSSEMVMKCLVLEFCFISNLCVCSVPLIFVYVLYYLCLSQFK